MDADAQVNPPITRQGAPCHLDHTPELGQQAIAHQFENAAMMLGDLGPEASQVAALGCPEVDPCRCLLWVRGGLTAIPVRLPRFAVKARSWLEHTGITRKSGYKSCHCPNGIGGYHTGQPARNIKQGEQSMRSI